jgi:transcriptional regulator
MGDEWRDSPAVSKCLRTGELRIIFLWATHGNLDRAPHLWAANRRSVVDKREVQPGTLALMILKTLDVLGPLHGYGVARRIEETSRNRLTLNYGTLYPALVKLEQEGFVTGEWGQSENNRRAKFYSLTPAGRKELARETREWQQTADVIAAFFALGREPA